MSKLNDLIEATDPGDCMGKRIEKFADNLIEALKKAPETKIRMSISEYRWFCVQLDFIYQALKGGEKQ